MTATETVDNYAGADAALAARLFLLSPLSFGGLWLRGAGPARDALVEHLKNEFEKRGPVRRLPGSIDEQALLGGIDMAASLAAGRPVHQSGLLERASGGALIVPLAERLAPHVAGPLASAMDSSAGDGTFSLILLDDSVERDEAPPVALTERMAFRCELSQVHPNELELSAGSALDLSEVAGLHEDARQAIAATAIALGVGSARALIFAETAARAHAALSGRKEASREDLSAAVRLVLAPRATQMPQQEEPDEDQPPPEQQEETPDDKQKDGEGETEQLEDQVLEAATAAIPEDLLLALTQGRARSASSGAGGKKHLSKARGRPLGVRPGMPRGGARLALVDSLRAAVPWQPLRRRSAGANDDGSIIVHKDDLRIHRYEERSTRVTIFVVDASGSAAAARLAEAKGAVELMLAQSYVTRSEVALVAFRKDGAELLLPPTRSLTRARRTLAEMPGGGGTPLASGLAMARELAESVEAKGHTPSLVILTDGRANITTEGQPGRAQAREDALSTARMIASRRIDALVIDISARASPEAGELASAMQARFLALPMADAAKLHAAIKTAQPGARAA